MTRYRWTYADGHEETLDYAPQQFHWNVVFAAHGHLVACTRVEVDEEETE